MVRPTRYPTEAALQAACLDGLRKLGIWGIRMGVSVRSGKRGRAQSGEPGMPDLCLPGLGWIEVKQPGETLNEDQLAWHLKAKKHGLRVKTVYNVADCLGTANLWRDAVRSFLSDSQDWRDKWQEQQPSKSRS